MTDTCGSASRSVVGVDHAFATWTERIQMWWPRDHTLSGGPAAIVFDGRVGGRTFERTSDGNEHEWGVVTVWRPPDLLAYTWHLGVGPEGATTVSVRFSAIDRDRTVVEIEQSGWERLGAVAADLRRRNRTGWESLVPNFRSVVENLEKGA